jgi:hypothetical protein
MKRVVFASLLALLTGALLLTLAGTALAQPSLWARPWTLTFAADTDSLRLDLGNSGSGDLVWGITSDQPWLTAVPAAGLNRGVIAVLVDRAGLTDGTYNGNLLITSNGGDRTVAVSMDVASAPVLSVTPTYLGFSTTVQTLPVLVENVGIGTLSWAFSTTDSWIEVIPPLSGIGDATVLIHVDPSFSGSPHSGSITVDSNGGSELIEVHFTPPPSSFAGMIGLYRDAAGTDCGLIDAAPGLLLVNVVHVNTNGATACQFAAPMPNCWTGATYLSDTATYPVTIGNSQTGMALGYGTCLTGTFYIHGINYFVSGLGQTCCYYPVIPDPNIPSGQIEVVDCGGNLILGGGGLAVINPDGTCLCGTIKTRSTTWGRLKATWE